MGVIFNAILFSLIGIVPNVYTLFALILVGGLGSAALYPAIASMARGWRKKPELAVGLFGAGGTFGIALGPLIIMILPANLGLTFTPWLIIRGILFWILLLIEPVGLLALTGILSNVAFISFTSAMPLLLVHEHHLPKTQH